MTFILVQPAGMSDMELINLAHVVKVTRNSHGKAVLCFHGTAPDAVLELEEPFIVILERVQKAGAASLHT
jgi:hypothetical protein